MPGTLITSTQSIHQLLHSTSSSRWIPIVLHPADLALAPAPPPAEPEELGGMEATAVSVGKAVLDGALGYAKSRAAEEIALQLGVERDVDFIRDELQMMQAFLMTADEEQSQNKVLTTWVKQIGVLAYKVEDSLMDFGLHSEKKPFLGCIPRNPVDRRRIAKEVKELRAKVEDVSNRNLRYRLIKESSGSKPTMAEEQASIATAAMFGINEARLATLEHEKSSEVDLHKLITSNDVDLRVIAVWGTSGDLGKTSAIQDVYDKPKVLERFGFYAWVRLTHPFNPQEFLRSLVRQFYENSYDEVGKAEQETSVGANVQAKMENMDHSHLVCVFNDQLCSKSYLIVIDDLSTIVEWHCLKKYFPDNKKQSRIIVSTQQVEIASLCTEKPYQVTEFKQLSRDQTIYLFHKKVMHESCSTEPISDSRNVTTTEKNTSMPTNKRQEEDQEPINAGEENLHNSTARKKFDHSRTLALADEVLCGRETEKSYLIRLVGQPDSNQGHKVISVWGMGGGGKTALVRSIYRSQQLGGWKRAWSTALRPFNPEVLLKDLALQLQNTIQEDPVGSEASGTQKKSISEMELKELEVELPRLLKMKRCLVVLDDISSTFEWNLINSCLNHAGTIIVTTREKSIAEHCSRESDNMYCLKGLEDVAALDLFKKKVFKDNIEKNDLAPIMLEEARVILQKCAGLPLAISTIGGFLATKPKTAIEWRKMNDCISSELEINPELRTIKTILMRSYDGLPYHLKSAFLYLSIFPEDHKIRWGRLVRRWVAEGYSRNMQLGRRDFDDLLDRSMILPGEGMDQYSQNINYCQLHDMIREICISKAREENLVFTLEEGFCLSDTQGAIRHLVIGRKWKRDKDVLENMLDLSHVRSLTVFGEWRSFFIFDNMRFLRVLDLEDTRGLRNHHLDKIGQLRHLKYLSLRGCREISSLPNSLCNLRHLETLDVRCTHIYKLPARITNLRKLQHLRAGNIVFPRGIGKLKALCTLGVVEVSRSDGKATIEELGEFSQLCKLKVRNMRNINSKVLWSAIAGHNQLQSLSVEEKYMYGEKYKLDSCLGEGLSPPISLESLTLVGMLVKVTQWTHKLQNLSKLVLVRTQLEQDDPAIEALGFLPNLAVLRLRNSFEGTQLRFQSSSFPNLMVLELQALDYLHSVLFEKDTMPKLELLHVGNCGLMRGTLNDISELPALTSLKEIRLGHLLRESVKEEVQKLVAEHMKHVRVNIVF